MKSIMMSSALATLALAAAPALAAQPDDPVQVDTQGLPRLVARSVEKHAALGMPTLRRYLWGTFHLHRVWLDDVLKPVAGKMAQKDAPAEPGKERVAANSR